MWYCNYLKILTFSDNICHTVPTKKQAEHDIIGDAFDNLALDLEKTVIGKKEIRAKLEALAD